jgi:hypothetical protein
MRIKQEVRVFVWKALEIYGLYLNKHPDALTEEEIIAAFAYYEGVLNGNRYQSTSQ